VQLPAPLLPVPAVVLPMGQTSHPVALVFGWYAPSAQGVQAVWFWAAENVPGAQASHAPGGAM
jgi:hypothetical protein